MGDCVNFDVVFEEAVKNLVEYYPGLADAKLVEEIKESVRAFHVNTGNALADYNRLEDNIERELEHVGFTDNLHI